LIVVVAGASNERAPVVRESESGKESATRTPVTSTPTAPVRMLLRVTVVSCVVPRY
jgi:hypothetical protein